MNKRSLLYWAWALFLTYALQVDSFAVKEAFLANDTHTSFSYTHQGGLDPGEGAVIYRRLGQIDFWAFENPESAQDLSTREVERVREAFEGIYLEEKKLPRCVRKRVNPKKIEKKSYTASVKYYNISTEASNVLDGLLQRESKTFLAMKRRRRQVFN